jgi:hypothetical protein
MSFSGQEGPEQKRSCGHAAVGSEKTIHPGQDALGLAMSTEKLSAYQT